MGNTNMTKFILPDIKKSTKELEGNIFHTIERKVFYSSRKHVLAYAFSCSVEQEMQKNSLLTLNVELDEVPEFHRCLHINASHQMTGNICKSQDLGKESSV